MKLKNILYGLSAVALVSLSSCDDFLDKIPDTRVNLESPSQLSMLLVTSYPSANYALVCGLSSDNYEDNNSPDKDGNRYNLTAYNKGDDELFAFEDVKSATDQDSPSHVWEAYYNAIAGANAVLEKIPEFEAQGTALDGYEKLPAIKGEALLIRAYCHFILANIFCDAYRGPELSKSIQGIPYITVPETTVKPHYDRGTLAEVYDRIEADLTAGLPLINNGLYEVPKYHFNTAAANAFAARFYLFKRDYEKALKHANAAFGGEGADVSQYMSDIWQNLGNFYYISDFGLYYNGIDKARNFLLIPTYSTWWRRHLGNRYSVTRDAKRATIQGPAPSWEGYEWRASNGTGEVFSMNPSFNGACGSSGKAEYGTYFAGTCCEQFEYTDKVAGIGYTHMTRSEFNGEETLLVRAEAKLFLGDKAGAIADLDVWEKARRNVENGGPVDRYVDLSEPLIRDFYNRMKTYDSDADEGTDGYGIAKEIHLDEVCPSERYTVTDDIEPILQCIQHCRRIETIHTGMRFFDIKRFGIEFTRKIGMGRTETLTMMDARKAIQIPTEVMSAGLVANPRPAPGDADTAIEVYEIANK
ncbi:MAG: RagB/SusD family nutrient uptake outer membrane protein [Muribaculaceae bacterium]|nr:RagB/SusD family nutrient uptake outer membrane protein [Muribaculaceae bacterium]